MTKAKKPGRPKQTENEIEPTQEYTINEIRDLWQHFRGTNAEVQLLEDLTLLERNDAIRLSEWLWQTYLNGQPGLHHKEP